jgi:hypothetical protein
MPCAESDDGGTDGGNDAGLSDAGNTDAGGIDAGNGDAGSDGGILSNVTVAPAYPLHGANWMDYVINEGGGGHAWDRPDVACTGTEPGYYKCLHGGELRQFQTTLGSCTNLTAEDSFVPGGAFNWVCDATTLPVVLRSRGLKPGKGLRDLINPATLKFKAAFVTARSSGTAVFQTATSVWWGNPLVALPTGIEPKGLTENNIYVVPTNVTTNGLFITSKNKVGLVTLGQAVLSYTGTTATWCTGDGQYVADGGGLSWGPYALCAGGPPGSPSRFLWIEATIDSTAGMNTGGIELAGVQMSRVHGTVLKGYGYGNGFDMSGNSISSSVLFDESAAAYGTQVGGPSTGFWLPNGGDSYITIKNSLASNSSDGFQGGLPHLLIYGSMMFNNPFAAGLNFGGSGVNVVGNTVFANQVGLNVNCNPCTVLANTSVDSTNTSVSITGANATIVNLVSAGSIGNGLDVNAMGGPTRLIDVVSTRAAGTAIQIDNVAGAAVTFAGTLKLGTSTALCSDTGGKSNLDPNCAFSGGITLRTADPTGSYIGVVLSDPANGSTFPAPMFSDTAMDWTHFSSPFRGWGANTGGALFPGSGTTWCGNSGTTTCSLYDLALVTNEPTPLLRGFYGTWRNDGTCPILPALITDTQGNNLLPSAIELLDPWLNPNGNYDGLCEGNEGCVYAPNMGAWQGSGDPYDTTPCTIAFPSGASTLWAYPNP